MACGNHCVTRESGIECGTEPRRSRTANGKAELQAPSLTARALTLLSPRRVFFGWWIVAATFLLGSVGGAVFFLGFSAFFLPLEREFQVPRATLSLVVGLASLEGAILGPFQGMLIDRFGPRRIMLAGITLVALGYVLISTTHSIVLFFLYYIPFIAVGMSTAVTTAPIVTVGNWFVRKRGIALAIAMSGFGLGGVLVTGTNQLIESLGWRGAAVVIAIIIAAVGFPATLLMRHRPEQYGQRPDGDKDAASAAVAEADRPSRLRETDFSVKQAIRTRAFWFLATAEAFRMFVISAVGAHFIPAMVDKGFSSDTGASLLAMFGFLTLPARLFFGVLSDRFPKRIMSGSLLALGACAMVLFSMTEGIGWVVVFVVVYAMAWGGGGGFMMLAIRGEYFGRKKFATISGLGSTVSLIGSISGPILAGLVYDLNGSYFLAFLAFAGSLTMSAVFMFLARRPAPPA